MKQGAYRLLMGLLQAPLLAKLWWRGAKEPLYRQHILERFGYYGGEQRGAATGALASGTTPTRRPTLWLHAVSLGETHASAPLLAAVRQACPEMRLVLTHGTATGRQAGTALLRAGDVQVWAPWDTKTAVARFLKHFQPDLGILMETEVWPIWAHACAQAGVPLTLVNARMSERSLNRTLRWGLPLMRDTYQQLAQVVPQSEQDAGRLAQLGAPLSAPAGNLKFDSTVNPTLQALGQQWRHNTSKPVVMLASAREGEEALFLDALAASPHAHAAQWLLVPRHPQRFDEVAHLARQRGFGVSRRSEWGANGPAEVSASPEAPTLWLGDTVGEMPAYYSLAHCALMGGTYLPFGGQNLIEACLYACPVLLGPSTFNFAQAAEQALNSGAALQLNTVAQALEAALALVNDEARLAQMQAQAGQFAHLHSGASRRTVQALAPFWPPAQKLA